MNISPQIPSPRPLTFGAAYRIKVDPSRPLQRDEISIIHNLSTLVTEAREAKRSVLELEADADSGVRQAVFFRHTGLNGDEFIYLEDILPRQQITKALGEAEQIRKNKTWPGNEASALKCYDRQVRWYQHYIPLQAEERPGYYLRSFPRNTTDLTDIHEKWAAYDTELEAFEGEIAETAIDASLAEIPFVNEDPPPKGIQGVLLHLAEMVGYQRQPTYSHSKSIALVKKQRQTTSPKPRD